MADFITCFNWMLPNENGKPPYEKNPDGCPKGCVGPCYAIAGVNSGAFPAQFAAIAAIPQAERGPAVQHFYLTEFWNSWFAQISSNGLAQRIFDEAVNAGEETAVLILQKAINVLSAIHVAVDGKWGPTTVAAANACNQLSLTGEFIQLRCAHYRAIYASNPTKYANDLAGWLARAEK